MLLKVLSEQDTSESKARKMRRREAMMRVTRAKPKQHNQILTNSGHGCFQHENFYSRTNMLRRIVGLKVKLQIVPFLKRPFVGNVLSYWIMCKTSPRNV